VSPWVSRAEWGAKPPSGSGNTLSAHPKGHAIHWEGPTMGVPDHDECDNVVRSIQTYHMTSNGLSDIAYNILVCQHGYQFEGRGKGKGSAANGTTQANADWYAICAMCGQGDPQGPDLIRGLQDAAATCRAWGAADGSTGHRDHVATECPGDSLYARVQAGEFTSGGTAGGGGSTPPPPAGTAPAFPLPSGWYFGPEEGPQESVSGYHGHADDLATWQARMVDRGWSLTADGLYGPETADVAHDFQAEKGLGVDSLIGAETWGAAWTTDVT